MTEKRPLLQANIRVTADNGEFIDDTSVYFHSSAGYQFPFAPESIRGQPFGDTLKRFYQSGNKIRGKIPVVMGVKVKVTYQVTGIEFGYLLEKLEGTAPSVVSLDDFFKMGMPLEYEETQRSPQ